MIYVGLDDTDTLDTRGTNQLAKAMARAVAGQYKCLRIVRHQLLEDPRVPCTSKNGSASLVLEPRRGKWDITALAALAAELRRLMAADFVEGSDPGLCVAAHVPGEVIEFGYQCQRSLVTQQQARDTALRHRVLLDGLGGTCDGVIGALAAIGLAAGDDDGRVVSWGEWPDNLSGCQSISIIQARGIEVRQIDQPSDASIAEGLVDVGKHLRPNWRNGRCVLFVERIDDQVGQATRWKAVKLP